MADPVGAVGAVNNTTSSSNIKSSIASLGLSLLGAVGTVGVSKLAQSQGQLAVATGNPNNPVVVVPSSQVAGTASQLSSSLLTYGLIAVIALAALFIIMGLRS